MREKFGEEGDGVEGKEDGDENGDEDVEGGVVVDGAAIGA